MSYMLSTLARRLVLVTGVLTSSIFSTASAHAQPQTELPEILVSAEATAIAPLKSARITVLIEASSQTAEAAASFLQKTATKVTQDIQNAVKSTSFADRGQSLRLEPSKTQGSPTSFSAARYLWITTDDISKVGLIVDTALRAGASTVTDVEYVSETEGEAKLKAMQEAVSKAKIKAELVAKSFGVKLGHLIGTSVNEEPAAAEIRSQMIKGTDTSHYNTREISLVVSARFEAARQ